MVSAAPSPSSMNLRTGSLRSCKDKGRGAKPSRERVTKMRGWEEGERREKSTLGKKKSNARAAAVGSLGRSAGTHHHGQTVGRDQNQNDVVEHGPLHELYALFPREGVAVENKPRLHRVLGRPCLLGPRRLIHHCHKLLRRSGLLVHLLTIHGERRRPTLLRSKTDQGDTQRRRRSANEVGMHNCKKERQRQKGTGVCTGRERGGSAALRQAAAPASSPCVARDASGSAAAISAAPPVTRQANVRRSCSTAHWQVDPSAGSRRRVPTAAGALACTGSVTRHHPGTPPPLLATGVSRQGATAAS